MARVGPDFGTNFGSHCTRLGHTGAGQKQSICFAPPPIPPPHLGPNPGPKTNLFAGAKMSPHFGPSFNILLIWLQIRAQNEAGF